MAPFDYTPPPNPHALHSIDEQVAGRTWARYTVRPGDSLAKLARTHQTSIAVLVHKNRISDPRRLPVGAVIQVPTGKAPVRSAAPVTRPAARAAVAPRAATAHKQPVRQLRTHVVRPGDNLITLGIRYGVGWSALMKANGLANPNQIAVGRVLQVPVRPGTPVQAPARPTPATPRAATPRHPVSRSAVLPRTHTVRPGENLIGLGVRYGVGWRALMNANHMSDPNRVSVGTVLRIPAKGQPVPAPAPARPTPKPAPPQAKPAPEPAPPQAKPAPRPAPKPAPRPAPKPAPPKTKPAPPKATPPHAKPAPPKAKPAPKHTAPTSSGRSSRNSSNTFLGRTYPDHVVASASRNREALRHVAVPSRSQTRDLIVQTARRYGVDPRLALAIGWQESGWNQRSVSVANAVGVMQVMPSTGTWCSDMVGRRLNLMNPRDNVTAGVVLLRWLTTHASSRDQAIAGYYQGLGGVRKNGMYPDTRAYVRSVKQHMARF
ncbi:LysM peptidoglycan-binding domain-containing protein [Luteipulveratus sp. YIM 133132]|uniref:lytic transglycosylase n=1 Tax=Luteipulveratus flavus TaxID=3031728 RepID=UPI0023B05D1A|nr:LysM peptidoglycan-binding domain-containing protein [Luteipulveratus sp. YIM 133132]MDE9366769.1 LysM peptidoglycan-binding domain-containing protein [Luteipulveratus sp. YIM 133132]